jgi:hypothetical protein
MVNQEPEDKYKQWVKDLPIKQDRVGQSTVRFQSGEKPTRTEYDPTYHGSRLNWFMAQTGRRDTVVNNVDMVVYNYKERIITIIESKHPGEPVRTGQEIMLKKLAKLLKAAEQTDPEGWRTEVVIIRGRYPYETSTVCDTEGNLLHSFQTPEQLTQYLNGTRGL